jgi:aspartyl-tRNA(Asn)/glutamyl-tRNA(Gln) amidotransferase subunit C
VSPGEPEPESPAGANERPNAKTPPASAFLLSYASGVNISRDTVLYIAKLSRLRLSDSEVERMRKDLDAILGYVAALQQVDTQGVPATTHVLDIATPLRRDQVKDVLPVAEVVRNAPEHTDDAMVVPKVLE